MRVPICTPSAPRANAAAIDAPSVMPPAAMIGTSTRERTNGNSTIVLTTIAPQVGGYGVAIIILTIMIRLVLLPLTLPSMKMAVKMRALQPQIDELKKIHGKDKQKLQQAQVELFKTHQVNPASGCLPNIFQFIILIGLYQVINAAIKTNQANLMQFLWLDITKPDHLFILPVVAAVTQLILGLMIMPAASTAAEKTMSLATKDKQDDKKADDMGAMAQTMQQQMIFMMPLMTLFLAFKFSAGLALYWVATTIFSIGQQYMVSGWGDLPTYVFKS